MMMDKPGSEMNKVSVIYMNRNCRSLRIPPMTKYRSVTQSWIRFPFIYTNAVVEIVKMVVGKHQLQAVK
jgi:hypothetical protein